MSSISRVTACRAACGRTAAVKKATPPARAQPLAGQCGWPFGQ
jgi:hypothetical protein